MPDHKSEEKPKKDKWGILSALTPLIIGLAVTGVGALFTNLYNYRQLQLGQLAPIAHRSRRLEGSSLRGHSRAGDERRV